MSRPEKILTARQIATLEKPGMHADGGGLYLRIDDKGRKSWIFRLMIAGKRRDMGLGSPPDVGLAAARDARDAARAAQRQGVDPIAAKHAAPAPAEEIPDFGTAASLYIKTHESAWRNEKHRAQWASTLRDYCETIRTKPVNQITTADILGVLRPIWLDVPETAKRVRARIENILDAEQALGHIADDRSNPARWKGHLDKLLPKSKRLSRGNHPAMPWADVPAFVAGLRRENSISARALEFTILTAARSGEVRHATPAEFDLDGKLWTVPKERMKAGREHRVPLVSRAVEIVRELRAAFPKETHVFPGVNEGKPMSDMTLLGYLRKRKLPFVVHGFRSSFADWRRESTTFNREIAEAALAHIIGDETEAAYSRGDVLEKRRELMEAWGRFLSGPEQGQIVSFPRRAKR